TYITTFATGTVCPDVTPEAKKSVSSLRLEGGEETLRAFGQNRLTTAMLSRGLVGLRGKTLIINLPGSRGAVEDGMSALFPAVFHVFRMMRGEGHGSVRS